MFLSQNLCKLPSTSNCKQTGLRFTGFLKDSIPLVLSKTSDIIDTFVNNREGTKINAMASNVTISKETLDQFCSITGSTKCVATRMLEACNGNLQMAIEMFMDGGDAEPPGSYGTDASNHEGADVCVLPDDDVRAPIPQKNETLVENTPVYEENCEAKAQEELLGFRGRRRKVKSVFDGFRDFEAEAKEREERQMSGPSTSQTQAVLNKKRTLEDLFRPPIDLMHSGSFSNARSVASSRKRWLMVNVQNAQEFACQALNRDIWSNVMIKNIIKAQFIFWQVYHDSEEGAKYIQFYKVHQWPYVAIIDPRTGENMASWNNLDVSSFIGLVNEFIADHPFCGSESDNSPPGKRPRVSSIMDETEEAQVQAAITASLVNPKEAKKVVRESDSEDNEDDDELETFTDSDDDNCDTGTSNSLSKGKSSQESNSKPTYKYADSNFELKPEDNSLDLTNESESHNSSGSSDKGVVCSNNLPEVKPQAEDSLNDVSESENHQKYLGGEEDPQTSLMIRFPDGTRKQWTVSCNSKLMALVLYVAEQGFSNERYELVTNFPRRKLSYMDFDTSIKDAGLHPQESIFVQAR